MESSFGIYPVYFFYGPENFLIDREVQRLIDYCLTPEVRDLNIHVFDGGEHRGQEILLAAQTVPMFSKYRIVLLREADSLDSSEIHALLPYVRKPSSTTVFIMTGQTMGSWKPYRRDLEASGRVLECARLKGKSLLGWLKKRMQEKGKTLTEEAAKYLVDVVGDHLMELENALEKSYLATGEKRTVDVSDVEELVSNVKSRTVYELTDAIGRRDVEKALSILNMILETKGLIFKKEEEVSKVSDPIPVLLSMIARQFRLIWKVKRTRTDQNKNANWLAEMGIQNWMLKSLFEQAKNFSEAALRDGILKCHRTDLAIKRGRGPKELLIEKLLMDLCWWDRQQMRS